jgi:dihydrofolate reductase
MSPKRRHGVGRYVYSMQVSLDGFIETTDRSLDWVIVDEGFHRFVNNQARDNEAFVNGRRLYEIMRAWETIGDQPDTADFMVEFAEIWNSKPKIVVSSSLTSVGPGARLLGTDNVDGDLERLRDTSTGDLDIGGATLAGTAIRLGLVDEYRQFIQPVVLGAGTPFFPPGEPRIDLELIDTHRFASGVVYVAYRPKQSAR